MFSLCIVKSFSVNIMGGTFRCKGRLSEKAFSLNKTSIIFWLKVDLCNQSTFFFDIIGPHICKRLFPGNSPRFVYLPFLPAERNVISMWHGVTDNFERLTWEIIFLCKQCWWMSSQNWIKHIRPLLRNEILLRFSSFICSGRISFSMFSAEKEHIVLPNKSNWDFLTYPSIHFAWHMTKL